MARSLDDSWDIATSVGATAVIVVGEVTEKLVAGTPPNDTPVTLVKSVPVIVTVVPPTLGPVAGLTAVTVGAGW